MNNTATATNEGARRRNAPNPNPDQEVPGTVPRIQRHRMPAGPMQVRGLPGRLLARLWDRAPWSRGAEPFVWPTPDLLMSELGVSRTGFYRAAKILADAGWVTRATKTVRGYSSPVRGWALHAEPVAGPLFAAVARPEDVEAAEVLLDTYGEDGSGTPESRKAGQSSPEKRDSLPIGTELNRTDLPPCAREPGEDDEDEDGYRDDKGNRTPPPPTFTPRPKPTPPPDGPPPAADADPEVEAWHAHEHERHERLGGPRTRPPQPRDLARLRDLVAYVAAREGLTVAAARLQVRVFIGASIRYAAAELERGADRGRGLAAKRLFDPFDPRAYDACMAFEAVAVRRVESRRAREWQPDWDPTPRYVEPEPVVDPISDEAIGAMADSFLAGIRPLGAS